jgi:hypothetical protein
MVPWKIVYSAASLLNFMTGLAVFLCPIAAIMATDYWLVKKRCVDVPSLYRRHGRYRYNHGINWRAAVALLTSLVPNLPGYDYPFSLSYRVFTNTITSLANAVNSSLKISSGIAHLVSHLPQSTQSLLANSQPVPHELSLRLCECRVHVLGVILLLSGPGNFTTSLRLRRSRIHRQRRFRREERARLKRAGVCRREGLFC